MSNFLTELEAKVHQLWAKLVADSHPAADDAKAILDQVKAEAVTDGEAVVKAAEPVAEAAVKDGEAIVGEAVKAAEADAPAVVEAVAKDI